MRGCATIFCSPSGVYESTDALPTDLRFYANVIVLNALKKDAMRVGRRANCMLHCVYRRMHLSVHTASHLLSRDNCLPSAVLGWRELLVTLTAACVHGTWNINPSI